MNVEETDKNTIVINAMNPVEILELGGGNTAVGFLGKIEKHSGGDAFLSFVQAYIDGACKTPRASATTLLLMIEGESDDSTEEIMKIVKQMSAEATLLGSPIEV